MAMEQKARQEAGPIQEAQGGPEVRQVIGREQIMEALATLNRYKSGKANLARRIVDNEQWYKLRHWESLRSGDKKEQVEPVSGWLFNALANKHADAMDNFPSCNILPREAGDVSEAKKLSSIIPVILQHADFEATYDEVEDAKNRTGTGIYCVTWDPSLHNGLGDVSIKKAEILNLYWESGVTDIQDSHNVFYLQLQDIKDLEAQYPQTAGQLSPSDLSDNKYQYDDSVDTTGKAAVVDWYYKKFQGGRTVLHYCKFVDNIVLYASENDPEYAQRGFYDHGEYPFVPDALFRVAGTFAGFGYIDVGKSAQEYIDRGNQAILKNMLANAAPRYFIRDDGDVREEEYADQAKPFVHVGSGLGQDSILPIIGKPLNGIYLSVLNSKIDELKETTGNRDISTGGSASGVTAASAIAAMQEAGSKLSRDSNKSAYRAFRKVVNLCIELVRQFYDVPRQFRILGEQGAAEFVDYSNAGLQPQMQQPVGGMDMGLRKPVVDIEVTAQKASPYSKLSQNELALQFFGAGFFNPELADQALQCLDMMDFDRKDIVMQKIARNGGLFQQMQQMIVQQQQIIDQLTGSNMAGAAAQMGAPLPGGTANPNGNQQLGGEALGESNTTRKARERVAESTSPV